MNLENIPNEILRFVIFKFIFGNCEKCNKLCYHDELVRKCKIFEYKNVYMDDSKEKIENYKLICTKCINKFNKKNIITFDNINFIWIKKFNLNKITN